MCLNKLSLNNFYFWLNKKSYFITLIWIEHRITEFWIESLAGTALNDRLITLGLSINNLVSKNPNFPMAVWECAVFDSNDGLLVEEEVCKKINY